MRLILLPFFFFSFFVRSSIYGVRFSGRQTGLLGGTMSF